MLSRKEVGNRIIYYLIDNDLSVQKFAEMVGSSRTSVYKWMNGKTMSNKFYIKMLKIFEEYTPSEWILEKSEEELKLFMFND